MTTSLWQLLGEYKIVVPSLQRDYAQGRTTGKAPLIREQFLNALHTACTITNDPATPLELDFIYGYTKDQTGAHNHFIPLDGQQRLTTLFLLHWYIAVKEQRMEEAGPLLANFTYETRHTSRLFCEQLVNFVPEDPRQPVRDTIRNQPWFFTTWDNDPTITAMLTMLQAIQQQFQGMNNIWPRLTGPEPRIVFHLLPMEKLGLPDDLYIKMNSRGKELTEFEYFKSRFAGILPPSKADIFNAYIDQKWSDLFWNLYKDRTDPDIARLVDYAFLRFFRYITDIQAALHNIAPLPQEFDYFRKVYTDEARIAFLFNCLNLFCDCYRDNPGFFGATFYIESGHFEEGKTRLFFNQPKVDLFRKCAENYDPSQRTNPFSIGEQLMLYACIVHLQQGSPAFRDRIRKVRNLVNNSEDRVRRENMASLLTTVSCIILQDQVAENALFNGTQVNEEAAKQHLIAAHSSLKHVIHRLEDHHLLQGCIALFKLEENLPAYAAAFQQLFIPEHHYDVIHLSLLTVDDYSQEYNNNMWRFGNTTDPVWRELFTPSSRRGNFQQTKDTLHTLLDKFINTPGLSPETVIQDYLVSFEDHLSKPRDWRYYFIRYEGFRKENEAGYYYWENFEAKPYECIKLRRTTWGGYHWSPYLYTLRDEFGGGLDPNNSDLPWVLTLGDATLHIFHINDGFKLEAASDGAKTLLEQAQISGLIKEGLLLIEQNENGIDVEDRIEKARKMITGLMTL